MPNLTSTIDPNVFVPKGWGNELWICNGEKYCGKILTFNPNKKCSIHYHLVKDEVLFIDSGAVEMVYFWNEGDEKSSLTLTQGMSFHVSPGLRHQMIAGDDGAKIIEFSTHHDDADSIRIVRGD